MEVEDFVSRHLLVVVLTSPVTWASICSNGRTVLSSGGEPSSRGDSNNSGGEQLPPPLLCPLEGKAAGAAGWEAITAGMDSGAESREMEGGQAGCLTRTGCSIALRSYNNHILLKHGAPLTQQSYSTETWRSAYTTIIFYCSMALHSHNNHILLQHGSPLTQPS